MSHSGKHAKNARNPAVNCPECFSANHQWDALATSRALPEGTFWAPHLVRNATASIGGDPKTEILNLAPWWASHPLSGQGQVHGYNHSTGGPTCKSSLSWLCFWFPFMALTTNPFEVPGCTLWFLSLRLDFGRWSGCMVAILWLYLFHFLLQVCRYTSHPVEVYMQIVSLSFF